MATLIKADGTITEVEPQTKLKKKKFSLQELQKFVGGYIEIVYLGGHRKMVVNEEGRIHNLDPNPKASEIAGRLIVGDVLIVGVGEM